MEFLLHVNDNEYNNITGLLGIHVQFGQAISKFNGMCIVFDVFLCRSWSTFGIGNLSNDSHLYEEEILKTGNIIWIHILLDIYVHV